MKRFLAFGGEHYYPRGGGMDDFAGSYDSLDEAIAALVEEAETDKCCLDDRLFQHYWAHIYDSELNKEVWTDRDYEAKEIKTPPTSSTTQLPSHGQEGGTSKTGVSKEGLVG